MKVSVSIPDELFNEAQRHAGWRKRKMSRDQLFAMALTDFITNERERVTAQINEVAAEVDTSLDPALMGVVRQAFLRAEW